MYNIRATAVGQRSKTVIVVKRFVCYCGCSKILPTKSTSISAVRLSYTYMRGTSLCMVPILPNKMRVIASFIGQLTS